MQFLMGLNDAYLSVRGQTLLIEPLPFINKVFSLVVQEERQRNITSISSHSVENSVFFSRTPVVQSTQGYQNFGHKFNGNGRSFVQKKERPQRSHCGFTGHTMDRCYKLHGYPPEYKPKSKPIAGSTGSVHQVSSDMLPPPNLQITLEQCQQLLALIPNSESFGVSHGLDKDFSLSFDGQHGRYTIQHFLLS